MEWEEMPEYWGVACRRYYDYAIEDGMSHEDAFRKQDLIARAPSPYAGLKYIAESEAQYIARLQANALSPDDALRKDRLERGY